MASGNQAGVLDQIRLLYSRGTNVGTAEGQLLDRFVSARDESALESLVERHGPMVLGVCRRHLANPHDVDDAFQATFLVFIKKARSLRDHDRLGPWLHGVAHRVAVRARANVARRCSQAQSVEIASTHDNPINAAEHKELREILETEIHRLPAKLRLPVILCCLEGRTYEEAAEDLCWAASTVRGRLVQARHQLRQKLERQGVAPALTLPLLTGNLFGKVCPIPQELVASTLKVALADHPGSSVGSLVTGTLRSLSMSRIRVLLSMMTAAGVLVSGMGFGVAMLHAQPDPDPKPIATPAKSAPSIPARPARRDPLSPEFHLVTVTGRAVDENGKPIAGAEIQVVDANASSSIKDKDGNWTRLISRTTTSPDGRYTFRQLSIPVLAVPGSTIPRPPESRLEVSGWAAGKAFAWHNVQKYRPEPRPAQVDPKDKGFVFFKGETIEADLTFGPPARIHGRVIDDSGKPAAGALIQVGAINDVRRPGSGIQWNCSTIALDGADPRNFGGIAYLPESLRSARTDANGDYAIEGLAREVKLITLIDFGPSYEPFVLTVATSAKSESGLMSLGVDGVLNHTFVTPRTVRVRAQTPMTGEPAPNVTITAYGSKLHRSGATAKTDAEGIAILHLQPDPYTLRIEPPRDMVAVVSEQPIIVAQEPRESSLAVALAPGAIFELRAFEGTSTKGVAGIGFDYVTDTTKVRKPVQSQTVFADHPVTDSDGRLRLIMPPGTYGFAPRVDPARLATLGSNDALISVNPGMSGIVSFSFKEANTQVMAKPTEDARLRHLQERWKAQSNLLKRGRLQATRGYHSGQGISISTFKNLMDSFDPRRVPDIDAAIRNSFPEAAPISQSRYDITVDEPRRRETSRSLNRDVIVFNGQETTVYGGSNAQVDLYNNKSGFRLHVAGIADYCHLSTLNAPIITEADGRLTLERKDNGNVSQLMVDGSTGFIYRDGFTYSKGTSGTVYWQFAPKPTPEGLIAPGLQVEMNYNDNRINVIWIRTIESIDLHSPISSQEFTMSVPVGTMILDYRKGRDDNYRGVTTAPVTDVLVRANEIAAKRSPFVSPIKLGSSAPKIEPAIWLDRTGKTTAPKMAGKIVLIDFWGITCGPCVAQLPDVREAVNHFANTDLLIIGMHDSSGTLKSVSEFATKRDLSYPLAIDQATAESGWFGVTFAAYGVNSIPSAAVIDRQGHVVFVGRFSEALEKASQLLRAKPE